MIKYDVDYYYNLLRIHTHTAKEISLRRWDFILQLMPELKNRHPVILDFGVGVGWFVAFKPEQIKEVDSFDIMPVPQTGIIHDHYDIVTMWDVLEHIDWKNEPDKNIEDILTRTDYVATTIPILPLGKDFETWKHNKKNEHLTRFKSLDEVIHFFSKRNFKLKEISSNECPPREDVYSFLFEKV